MKQTNCCQWPILGELTTEQFRDILLESITDEANTIDFYCCLINEAPNELFRDFISDARDDEKKHLAMFENLYCCCFNEPPQYTTSRIKYSCFKEGLVIALQGELGAVSTYKNVQLSVQNQIIRDTFYFAMVDELEHAIRFSTLINMC